MKHKKILVCVHIYYHNQVDYIVEKLKNIKKYDYDLYVTYSQENQETKEKFIDFNKNTNFLLTENIGYDIYPFLVLIDKIDLDNYDCLLKLHTKNHDKYGSYNWRDDLYENLLDTEYIFRNNFNKLKKYGMVGSKKWILKMGDKLPEDSWLYEKICTEKRVDFSVLWIKFDRETWRKSCGEGYFAALTLSVCMTNWKRNENVKKTKIFKSILSKSGPESLER